jgi:hypothetical protein
MGLPADTYRQLTAMANAADRSNRPTTLLAVPALAVIAGLIVLFISWSGYAQKRETLEAMEYQTTRLARLVGQYESLRAAQVDETRQYPPIPDFELKVIEAYDDAGIPFERPPSVRSPSSRNLPTTDGISRTTIKAVSSNEPLENILQWVHNVIHHPDLEGRAFVYAITLTPIPGSERWSGNIDFAIYETRN